MPSIVIRLDPELLSDPNLDLRYRIPNELEAESNGLLSPDGYDYEEDSDAMQIYVRASDLDRALRFVLEYVANERPFGNDLRKAAVIGVSDIAAEDTKEFSIVFPEGRKGVIKVP